MHKKTSVLCLFTLWFGLSGCISTHPTLEGPKQSSFKQSEQFSQELFRQHAKKITEPTGDVTLEKTLALAFSGNPDLAVFPWEFRAAEARILQAGLRPNPEVGIEFENVDGNGEFSGGDALETTASVAYLIELGGKRAKRRRVETYSGKLLLWDYREQRLEVEVEAKKRFLNLLAAQKRAELTQQSTELAEKMHHAVKQRVDAGAVSRLEEQRATVMLMSSRIEHQKAMREVGVTKKRLAAIWGSSTPKFDRAVGNFFDVSPVHEKKALKPLILNNPQLSRWATEITQRRTVLDLEQANAIPDVEIGLGLLTVDESGDQAATLEFSLPLPLFDRNQGGIQEAQAEISKAAVSQKAAATRLDGAFEEAYQILESTASTAISLRDQVLPIAMETFDAVESAYKLGKADFIEMLDAQRTLIEVRRQLVDTLGDYHEAVIEVEAIIAQPLPAGN